MQRRGWLETSYGITRNFSRAYVFRLYTISLTLTVIISSQLGQSLPSNFVPEDFPTTLLHEFLVNPFVLHVSLLIMSRSSVSITRNTAQVKRGLELSSKNYTTISTLCPEHRCTITESLTQRILELEVLLKTVEYVKNCVGTCIL